MTSLPFEVELLVPREVKWLDPKEGICGRENCGRRDPRCVTGCYLAPNSPNTETLLAN